MLDNAPSFLVRQKSNGADHFPAPDINTDDEPDDASGPAQPSTRVTPLRPASVPAPQPGKAALQAAQLAEWLVEQGSLTTFRTFRSFAYSASLLFYPRELTYYAVLYNQDAVWRVLKSGDLGAAESAFRHFVEHTMRLADAEMRRAHLEAQNEQFSRLIAESEAQIERVRVDVQSGSQHDQEVALRQQEIRKELAQLEGKRVAAQSQLNKLQRQLHQLNTAVNENVPHLPTVR